MTAPIFPGGSADAPRGIRNNNPLNIRLNPANKWRGKVTGNDIAFETFASPEFGIRAAVRLMQNRGAKPMSEIISVWAPPTENDTEAYIRSVATQSDIKPHEIVDPRDKEKLLRLLKAMILHENGQQPYSDATILAGIELAF